MNAMLAAFFGGWEIVLILVIFLILFGAKKLPELAKGLGQGIKEFKKATREVTDEIQNAAEYTPPPSSSLPRQVANGTPSTPVTTSAEKSAAVSQPAEQKV